MKHYTPGRILGYETAPTRTREPKLRKRQALANVTDHGPVVYAFRLKDGTIKIGHTTDLARRYHELGGEVLAFRYGTRDDEQAIHATLRAHRAHSWEYYHPAPEVLAIINGMRAPLNLPPL